MSTARELPDVARVVGPVLERVAAEKRPLLVAIAERMAAERYRGWAERAKQPEHAESLRACADREEEIARRVESLFPDAAATQADLRAGNPDLEELSRSLFEDRPIDDQYTIQAQGERVGAATWRSFARDAEPAVRDTFLGCAELEEQNAAALEALLGR